MVSQKTSVRKMACASRRIRARGGDSVGHRFIAFCGAGLHIPRAGLCQGAGGKKIPPGTASNCAFCPMAASSGLFCSGRVPSELTRHFLWLALRALPVATSHSASCGMVTPSAKKDVSSFSAHAPLIYGQALQRERRAAGTAEKSRNLLPFKRNIRCRQCCVFFYIACSDSRNSINYIPK